jgi:hypothetical protein
MIITQIMHDMKDQYSRVPMPSLLYSLYHAYAVKPEYKQCTQMSGGVNKPLLREDSCTQKRFIYRLLTRHDFLPVWLVADK